MKHWVEEVLDEYIQEQREIQIHLETDRIC